MSKRKTAKRETPQLPVLYVAERYTDIQVDQPDRITVKRFKAISREGQFYRFDQLLNIGDGRTWYNHLISKVDRILSSGGRELDAGAVAATPAAALELLMRSDEIRMAYLASQVEGRRKTIDAIRLRIDQEAAKSKKKS